MTSLVFPDINVWLALVFDRHLHSAAAQRWYDSLDPSTSFVFCRHTQLGLLRLLSTEPAMGDDVMTQRQCWQVYDRWFESGQAILFDESKRIEARLRARTSEPIVAPKLWADAYLAAFAEAAGLTLVTFDRALAGRVAGSVLLG
jgi:toxin-antitoxin system PIN domain toxin